MGERWHVTNGWWGDRAVDSVGRCALALVGVVAIVVDILCGVVGVVHGWAGDVTRETAQGVVAATTDLAAGFELLAAEAAGQQVR